MSKALIVDDHPVVVAAVKIVLEKERFHPVLEASNASEAQQIIRTSSPDLVILDLLLKGQSGLEFLERLKQDHSPCRVLVFTSQNPELYVSRCMNAGALGFVAKTNNLQELISAVRAVMSGYTYYPQQPNSLVNLNGIQRSERQLIETLSQREMTIFRYLASGYSNKKIAEDMFISHKTVSTYKTRLIAKLNVKSLIHLREFAKRNQLI